MIQKLDEERDAGRIDGVIARTIQGSMISVLRGLGGEYAHVMKGVKTMLEGQILDLEVFRIHDKAWDEGREEGQLTLLFDLVGKGRLTEIEASEEMRMSIADFQQRMKEYNRAHA